MIICLRYDFAKNLKKYLHLIEAYLTKSVDKQQKINLNLILFLLLTFNCTNVHERFFKSHAASSFALAEDNSAIKDYYI